MAMSKDAGFLPKKVVGASALFLNSRDEVLIVKPSYRDGWLLPGGSVEALESPLVGCIREIKEELGLDITDPDLVGVHYRVVNVRDADPYDALHFTFWGGVLNDDQIRGIVLQKEELTEYRFVSVDQLSTFLAPHVLKRTTSFLESYKKGVITFLEE